MPWLIVKSIKSRTKIRPDYTKREALAVKSSAVKKRAEYIMSEVISVSKLFRVR